MTFRTAIASMTTAALLAVPTIAQAAPANRAAPLSVTKSVRTGSATTRASKLGSGAGGLAAAAILAGIAAIGVIVIVDDSDDSDSN